MLFKNNSTVLQQYSNGLGTEITVKLQHVMETQGPAEVYWLGKQAYD